MENVRHVAMYAVGKAVFFGGFAISITMLAFAFDFSLSFRAGAILTLIMSVILLWFAQTAHSRNPRGTETWILLEEDSRPQNVHAKRAFCGIMKEVYGYYGYYTVLISISMFVISLLLGLFGIKAGLG